jgi:hypothetical protein
MSRLPVRQGATDVDLPKVEGGVRVTEYILCEYLGTSPSRAS